MIRLFTSTQGNQATNYLVGYTDCMFCRQLQSIAAHFVIQWHGRQYTHGVVCAACYEDKHGELTELQSFVVEIRQKTPKNALPMLLRSPYESLKTAQLSTFDAADPTNDSKIVSDASACVIEDGTKYAARSPTVLETVKLPDSREEIEALYGPKYAKFDRELSTSEGLRLLDKLASEDSDASD